MNTIFCKIKIHIIVTRHVSGFWIIFNEHICNMLVYNLVLCILAFADSTLDNEDERLEMAFVTDMTDQKEAVDSVDDSL